jgi:hypothetical protein
MNKTRRERHLKPICIVFSTTVLKLNEGKRGVPTLSTASLVKTYYYKLQKANALVML